MYTFYPCLNHSVGVNLLMRRLAGSSGGVQRDRVPPRVSGGRAALLPQTGGSAGRSGGAAGVSLLVRLPAGSRSGWRPVRGGPGGFPVRRVRVSPGVHGGSVRVQRGKRPAERLPRQQPVGGVQRRGPVLLRPVRVSRLALRTHLRAVLRVRQLLLRSLPRGALRR